MFYSQDILTSRKYGVATVWLVATLGAKSSVRKVSRKAILDVDIQRACESIIEPQAPLALRLQSNLLYGVSRVYSQQCGYVLSDAQSVQVNLRTMLRAHAVGASLDAEAGRARPDQLIVMDDPAFIPELALPPADFDLQEIIYQVSQKQQTQQQTPSTLLTINSASKSTPASRSKYNISISSGASHALPVVSPYDFGGHSSSIMKTPTLRMMFDDELEGIAADVDFEFDADGNIVEISNTRPDTANLLGISPTGPIKMTTDSSAVKRVRQEHADALAMLEAQQNGRLEDEDAVPVLEDDMSLALDDEIPLVHNQSITADIAARRGQLNIPSSNIDLINRAPANLRKSKNFKEITRDGKTEISKMDLKNWQTDYPANMLGQTRLKHTRQLIKLAKQNADAWIFGNGVADVGKGIGLDFDSPLGMFAGDHLRAALFPESVVTHRSSTKRGRHEDLESEQSRRVRPRTSPQVKPQDETQIQLGRIEEEPIPFIDDELPPLGDGDVEMGRDARSALENNPSSTMPWNVSSSVQSHRVMNSSVLKHGFIDRHSSSIGNPASSRARMPPPPRHRASSRMIEDSPLFGRGSFTHLPDIERLDLNSELSSLQDFGGAPIIPSTPNDVDEFAVFGPAAEVDTQTAELSQWVKSVLNIESYNFLQYAGNSILEAQINDESDMDVDGEDIAGSVQFQTLFPVESNSRAVAAQAFLHVLTLATKNLLSVSQDRVGSQPHNYQAYGTISISLKDGVLSQPFGHSAADSELDIEMA